MGSSVMDVCTVKVNFSLKEKLLDILLTDMVDGSSTKLAIKLLGSKTPQILNGEGPKMEHIVSGECIPLLQQNHLGSKEAQLYGCT